MVPLVPGHLPGRGRLPGVRLLLRHRHRRHRLRRFQVHQDQAQRLLLIIGKYGQIGKSLPGAQVS